MTPGQDHFALFGLQPTFTLDTAALDSRYRAVQAEVHPDRFAGSSDAERRRAVQVSAQVNDAYQTLRSPLARARYLLGLLGVDTATESNTAMPAEFLMAQMEWREQFEDARASRDIAALEALHDALREQLAEGYRQLARVIDSSGEAAGRDLDKASGIVRELMFVDRLGAQVNDVLAEIE
jgi:molecular chaperone HscB